MSSEYQPRYSNSWALIIGINEYQCASRLEYARNDAEAIAQILIENYNFPADNVIKLFDENATKQTILSNYMRFSRTDINEDDKFLFYFAGHGHTITGRRTVGYLVPVDGNDEDLSTLIRWDELMNNADLIRAKHMFFILDACFSGLAIKRTLPPGTARYLNDMLQRYSRQVLTAGKADQTVSDSGGPVPEHSIFTGHLIQALKGESSGGDGIITANKVMAYVTDKVSKDVFSSQSPHSGYIDGDGDFIFSVIQKEEQGQETKISKDMLIEVPFSTSTESKNMETLILEEVKEYISDERNRIKLDTFATREIRRFLSAISSEAMPLSTSNVKDDDIRDRLKKYENLSMNLQTVSIAISHWGNDVQIAVLKKIISRLGDQIKMFNGNTVWLEMQWYPIMLLIYVSFIAAIESGRFENIFPLISTRVMPEGRYTNNSVLVAAVQGMMELNRMKIFNLIHNEANYYAPLSEHLFKIVQPILDDILFLGKSYEHLFDKAEILIALIYADLTTGDDLNHVWGPLGRFAWKYSSSQENAFVEMKKEASVKKQNWQPLQAGLFSGSYERFEKLVSGYEVVLKGLNWW